MSIYRGLALLCQDPPSTRMRDVTFMREAQRMADAIDTTLNDDTNTHAELIVPEPSPRQELIDPSRQAEWYARVGTELKRIVDQQRLTSKISGREYVRVEGWQVIGGLTNVSCREVDVHEDEGDWVATCEIIDRTSGMVISSGSALVGRDEATWQKRARYARRSMAITRASGKAWRLAFGWLMQMAGYESTPAEEMEAMQGVLPNEESEVRGSPPAKPKPKQSPVGSPERSEDLLRKYLTELDSCSTLEELAAAGERIAASKSQGLLSEEALVELRNRRGAVQRVIETSGDNPW